MSKGEELLRVVLNAVLEKIKEHPEDYESHVEAFEWMMENDFKITEKKQVKKLKTLLFLKHHLFEGLKKAEIVDEEGVEA